jgi:hypothetical protein
MLIEHNAIRKLRNPILSWTGLEGGLNLQKETTVTVGIAG